jgi:hypothetical protein
MILSEKTLRLIVAFLLGCIITTNIQLIINNTETTNDESGNASTSSIGSRSTLMESFTNSKNNNNRSPTSTTSSTTTTLDGIRILVAITSFDFSQIPHLEEVIDSYQDLCVTSVSKIDIVIYTTHAYPVPLIDLWNNRINTSCRSKNVFSMTIIVKPYSMRLFLVDCHRYLFYEKIDEYDLFIYTEDDMIVRPKLIASYMDETERVIDIVGLNKSQDFNVGVVRYEYNFPSNVIIDDNTRHSTQNVTRVYWEHFKKPIFPKTKTSKVGASRPVRDPQLENTHIQMTNHHQGMFLVTPYLLKAWKDRPGCEFANVRMHPNVPTQRVWMSSFMMYGYPPGKKGPKACNIQQVIPIDTFGTLNVFHLPNKNHRRVGKYKNITRSDGTEPDFDFGGPDLLTAMHFHIEMIKHMGQIPNKPSYNGIRMIDERSSLTTAKANYYNKKHYKLEKEILMETDNNRFIDYKAYVERGGVMSEYDMTQTDLLVGDTFQRKIDIRQKGQKRTRNKNARKKEKALADGGGGGGGNDGGNDGGDGDGQDGDDDDATPTPTPTKQKSSKGTKARNRSN